MTVKGFLGWLAGLATSRGDDVTISNPRAKVGRAGYFGMTGRVMWQRGERIGIQIQGRSGLVFTHARNTTRRGKRR